MADRRTRRSKPPDLPDLSEEQIADLEAENGLLQFDRVRELINEAVESNVRFRLRPSTLLELNRLAVQGLEPAAGTFRTTDIEISGTTHVPPPPHAVPRLVDEICDYVNDHWDLTPIHLAAYLMWRLNWVHPFDNGNGRTSRAVSYLVLCVKLGYLLPGTPTIPEMIARAKGPYYAGLDAADSQWAAGVLDVHEMEQLLRSYLASQLLRVVEEAGGD